MSMFIVLRHEETHELLDREGGRTKDLQHAKLFKAKLKRESGKTLGQFVVEAPPLPTELPGNWEACPVDLNLA